MHCYLGSSRMFVVGMFVRASEQARERDKSNDTFNTDENVRKRRIPVPEFSSHHLPQFKRNLFWLPSGIHNIYYMYMCMYVFVYVHLYGFSLSRSLLPFVYTFASHPRINTAEQKKSISIRWIWSKNRSIKKVRKVFQSFHWSISEFDAYSIICQSIVTEIPNSFSLLQQQIIECAHTRVSSGRNGIFVCIGSNSCSVVILLDRFFAGRLCQPTKNENILLQYSGGRMSCSSIHMVSCALWLNLL